MFSKRVNLFMGHYGSGKTFVSVNYAEALKRLNKQVAVYDLDIVNPYFRTIDAVKRLKDKGIELIVSDYAQTNVDLPSINSSSYKLLDKNYGYAVLDIGGDDRGALALGRFAQKIIEENDFNAYFVLNKFRPETNTVEGALEIMHEIEMASKLPFTAIINNSNVGELTTTNDVLEGLEFAKQVSRATGLKIAFTAVKEQLINEQIKNSTNDILPINPIVYGNWL